MFTITETFSFFSPENKSFGGSSSGSSTESIKLDGNSGNVSFPRTKTLFPFSDLFHVNDVVNSRLIGNFYKCKLNIFDTNLQFHRIIHMFHSDRRNALPFLSLKKNLIFFFLPKHVEPFWVLFFIFFKLLTVREKGKQHASQNPIAHRNNDCYLGS